MDIIEYAKKCIEIYERAISPPIIYYTSTNTNIEKKKFPIYDIPTTNQEYIAFPFYKIKEVILETTGD